MSSIVASLAQRGQRRIVSLEKRGERRRSVLPLATQPLSLMVMLRMSS
jgi:hypothetical protein